MPRTADIAILGAGYSGSMLALALSGSTHSVIRIDDSGDAPHGAAYSTKHREHLLNVPAARMGAMADDIGGFLTYARAQQPSTEEDAFLPRALYGEYLRSLTTSLAAPVEAHITRIVTGGRGYRLYAGAELICDTSRLVLATGNSFSPRTSEHPHYYPEPWRCDFDGLRHHTAPIVILGSGLTAVDTLVSLITRAVKAPITVISRHGEFPAIHANHPMAEPPAFAASMLASGPLSQRMRRFRRFIRDAMLEGYNWQAAIDALRSDTVMLWKSLDDEMKARFFRHCFSHWNRMRHRMASTLSPILARGAYHIRKASVTGVNAAHVTLANGEQIEASIVFDCRGPGYNASKRPIFTELIREGILLPHSTGLGFSETGEAGLISIASAAPIHAIGPLLVGARLETTAVPELRYQVQALAAHLS